MATVFLSTANTLFPSLLSSSSSSSSSTSSITSTSPNTQNVKRSSLTVITCKASASSADSPSSSSSSPINLTKRSLAISLTTTFTLSLAASSKGTFDAAAAILEADDDLELLEKVKKDRKKRLEQQGIISSATTEKASLQELVYRLSKVGQAIDNNDLSAASSVLGPNTKTDWVQKVNSAFTKLSSSDEETTEVETFKSSLATLISSVAQNDINSSKTAFLSSAVALEKWTALTGLIGQLKGL